MNKEGGVDQKLVVAVCQEMMKMFKDKGTNSRVPRDYANASHGVPRDLHCFDIQL